MIGYRGIRDIIICPYCAYTYNQSKFINNNGEINYKTGVFKCEYCKEEFTIDVNVIPFWITEKK